MNKINISINKFILVTIMVSIWINISEIFRYFIIVMPRVKAFFEYKTGIAEMNVIIFSIWGIWDTLLTAILVYITLLLTQNNKDILKSSLASGTLVWLSTFVIFWLATANMGLCEWGLLLIVLPLSLFEMIVGSYLALALTKPKH